MLPNAGIWSNWRNLGPKLDDKLRFVFVVVQTLYHFGANRLCWLLAVHNCPMREQRDFGKSNCNQFYASINASVYAWFTWCYRSTSWISWDHSMTQVDSNSIFGYDMKYGDKELFFGSITTLRSRKAPTVSSTDGKNFVTWIDENLKLCDQVFRPK